MSWSVGDDRSSTRANGTHKTITYRGHDARRCCRRARFWYNGYNGWLVRRVVVLGVILVGSGHEVVLLAFILGHVASGAPATSTILWRLRNV